MEVSIDVVGGTLAAIAAIIYVVRMEGRLNTLQAILERVESGQKTLEQRYNLDGKYGVTERTRRPYPAE